MHGARRPVRQRRRGDGPLSVSPWHVRRAPCVTVNPQTGSLERLLVNVLHRLARLIEPLGRV